MPTSVITPQQIQSENAVKAWTPIVISIVGIFLAIGYNWRRVDEVSAQVTAMTATLQSLPNAFGSTYVRQDVHSMQIEDISRQLAEIKALIKQRAEQPVPYARRFDK